MVYDYGRAMPLHMATDESDAEEQIEFGELQIADYLVFLLAFDTYMRWMKEEGRPTGDPAFVRGLTLLKNVERQHIDRVEQFLKEGLTNPASLRMLENAMKLPPTPRGASMRALRLRTILSRGGTATAKHVFGKSIRARREVTDAIESAMLETAPEAFAKFSTIVMRDKRLQQWLTRAKTSVESGGEAVPVDANPIHEASKQVAESTEELRAAHAKQDAHSPASEEHASATQAQADVLKGVEMKATEAAAQTLVQKGQDDTPPTRSEVIGIATAAATAAVNGAEDPAVKAALTVGGFELDGEQKTAALTDGRVLVAAGAGAGKSTTLVGRLKYLVNVRHETPSRILVATFNSKAAEDLKGSIVKELGAAGDAVACGTMHSLFRNFIGFNGKRGYGTPEESQALSDGNLIAESRDKDDEEDGSGFVVEGDSENREIGAKKASYKPPNPRQMTAAVRGVVKDLGPGGLAQMTGLPEKLFEANSLPSAKICKQLMENWSGNDVDAFTALKGAETIEEVYSSVWMEIYAGLKGDRGPDWKPMRVGGAFPKFMKQFRPDGRRLADLNDMLLIFRDILERDPTAREAAQKLFDHVLVDEAQDLNVVQHDIFGMMTEKVEPGNGKSFWIVGDDKQAIYQFRGARPGLFSALDGKEGWTSRLIQTNYRCDPEIVEAANRVTSNNQGQIAMTARPDPKKPRGRASIEVETPPSYVDIAGDVIESFDKMKAVDPSTSWSKGFAVLSRTNNELNAFEDQCIIHEVPYRRSKGKGFLESAESNCVLGYMDLALSSDNEELQTALVNTVGKPDRGVYLGQDVIEKITREALKDISREQGVDVRNLNPLDVLMRRPLAKKLAQALKEPYRAAKIAGVKKMELQYGQQAWFRQKIRDFGYEWTWWQDVDELTQKLLDMGQQIVDLRKSMQSGAKTTDILDRILNGIKTEVGYYNKKTGQDTRKTVSLKDQIRGDIAYNRNPDDDEDEKTEKKVITDENGTRRVVEVDPATGQEVDQLAGLGTVRYLYDIARPNTTDEAVGTDPTQAKGFYAKMDRYKETSKRLQDPKVNPDRLTLSTVHSVKGAQWDHVALCCSPGFFPVKRKEETTGLEEQLAKINAKIPWPADERAKCVDHAHAHIEDPMTSERNLAYVGVTRAKTDLKVICSQERVKKKSPSDPPQLGMFVNEAKLVPGQNVQPAPPPEPVVKTAFVIDVPDDFDRYLPASPAYDRRGL